MGESTTLEQRRDATGGRFETLDLRSASPTNFKVQATGKQAQRSFDASFRIPSASSQPTESAPRICLLSFSSTHISYERRTIDSRIPREKASRK